MKKRYGIRQIFAQMELDLVKSMKRNLAAHEAEEERLGFEWIQWQARKLASLKQFQKENRQIVEQAAPDVEDEVKRTIGGSFRRGAKSVADAAKRLWSRFGFGKREDLSRPASHEDNDENFFKVNKPRVDALTAEAQGQLRDARHAMLRKMDDVYRQTIYKAQVYHNAGAASLSKAVDMATKEFLDKGIDCITYSDGRKVNVASYAEMALRTAAQRAVFTGEGAKRNALGIRTVAVSSHSNCSPTCLPWQGKVYIDDVYSGGTAADGPYPLLSTAMAGGLFHPNCRHNMSTYIPGVSKLPEPVDDSEALANYKAEQRQRYMERQIRRYKRREAGAADPDNQAAASAKVKEWQGRLRGHLAEHEDLRRDSKREQTKLPPITLMDIMEQRTLSDQKQFDRYKLIYKDKLGAESLADFQRIKYNDSNRWEQIKAERQQTLNALDYEEAMFGQFGNKEVREWYIAHDKNIVNLIDREKPLKDQALHAHSLRNKYRSEARLMMDDREEAEKLNQNNPHIEFDALVKSKMERKNLTMEQAYQDIIDTAGKTNKAVNKKLGLE
ncbi:minor capsid 2 protein [Paenibacillus curdlanolyticus YK9]|uniref:Minor capsid 2 protein n=1 Tax=Paenibacillus curdlanolyticus YK9 TaxID=717606 RepID=E0IBT1_9BACL|nr:minor capsid 2 protein [Paenibacillus curdlanolyticus]EFM10161.1 minor capsid 2 protein [Paenibacillus curdlanolyticus YK9]